MYEMGENSDTLLVDIINVMHYTLPVSYGQLTLVYNPLFSEIFMIHLIYTGGTLGMVRRPDGALTPAGVEQVLQHVPELSQVAACDSYTLAPPRDSVDIGPTDWLRLSRHIGEHYDAYDGFVILHGTDTMVYTAAALSFLLSGLHKPVILTGAQAPIGQIRNDARNNLLTAVELAACGHPQTHEVGIYFHDRLLRGNRAIKVSASDFAAFDSPNCPPLAEVGTHIHFPLVPPLPPAPSRLQVQTQLITQVALIKLFPGMQTDLFGYLMQAPIRGLVIESFGSGTFPNMPGLLQTLEKAIRQRDLLVVAVSQQWHGRIRLDAYAAGRRLLDAGVVSGHDMTASAALVKLMVLLAQDLTPAQRRQALSTNLRGELTAEES